MNYRRGDRFRKARIVCNNEENKAIKILCNGTQDINADSRFDGF